MLTVSQARERILSHFQPLPSGEYPLEQAAGRVLTEDIAAHIPLPPFDNSSMDGFAVRAADTAGAPCQLAVIADLPAGTAPDFALTTGQAARITTGAMLPSGADAVVPVEQTDQDGQPAGNALPGKVRILAAVQPGENIRPAGGDVQPGQIVLRAGRRLRPADLGLLAMLGHAEAPVHRPAKMAVFSGGDELLPPGAPLTPAKVHDANLPAVTALGRAAGAQVETLGVAADTLASVQAMLERAAAIGPDLIVSTAGVSVGTHDYVRQAVETDGRLEFWKVNMRPGKPLAFGEYRGIPFIGLPGNPVSALIGFEVFVRPALERLHGLPGEPRPTRTVVLEQAIESDGRESFLRAVVRERGGVLTARLTGHQGSGNLLSLVQANALLIIPSGVKSCPPESRVQAWLDEGDYG